MQRAAKLHEQKGGGSLTLLLVLPGTPATGRTKKKPDLSKYQHLSPEIRAKLEAALAGQDQGLWSDSPDIVRTEVSQNSCPHQEVHGMEMKCTMSLEQDCT